MRRFIRKLINPQDDALGSILTNFNAQRNTILHQYNAMAQLNIAKLANLQLTVTQKLNENSAVIVNSPVEYNLTNFIAHLSKTRLRERGHQPIHIRLTESICKTEIIRTILNRELELDANELCPREACLTKGRYLIIEGCEHLADLTCFTNCPGVFVYYASRPHLSFDYKIAPLSGEELKLASDCLNCSSPSSKPLGAVHSSPWLLHLHSTLVKLLNNQARPSLLEHSLEAMLRALPPTIIELLQRCNTLPANGFSTEDLRSITMDLFIDGKTFGDTLQMTLLCGLLELHKDRPSSPLTLNYSLKALLGVPAAYSISSRHKHEIMKNIKDNANWSKSPEWIAQLEWLLSAVSILKVNDNLSAQQHSKPRDALFLQAMLCNLNLINTAYRNILPIALNGVKEADDNSSRGLWYLNLGILHKNLAYSVNKSENLAFALDCLRRCLLYFSPNAHKHEYAFVNLSIARILAASAEQSCEHEAIKLLENAQQQYIKTLDFLKSTQLTSFCTVESEFKIISESIKDLSSASYNASSLTLNLEEVSFLSPTNMSEINALVGQPKYKPSRSSSISEGWQNLIESFQRK